MKNFTVLSKWILLMFITAIGLASCLDTEERIELNADQSGTYTIKIEMGKMFDMLNALAKSSDSSVANKPKEKKDTSFLLKNMLDQLSLSQEEKAIFSSMEVKWEMDEAVNLMNLTMRCPFTHISQLPYLREHIFAVFKKVNQQGMKDDEEGNGQEMNDAMSDEIKKYSSPTGDKFRFEAKSGEISNTVINLAEFRQLVQLDSTLVELKKSVSSMGDMHYSTVFVLPNAAQFIEGPGKTISEDKRTVGFRYTFTDIMEKPETISYKVKY
ncbi:MAG: hypothetical protein ACOYKE_11795 [Ferruginibacter sp.]